MMRIILILFMFVLFSQCDYLDVVPENDIETIETIFEKKENADMWLRTCYSFYVADLGSIKTNPALVGSDELVSGEYFRKRIKVSGEDCAGTMIADGLQMSQAPYGELWKTQGFYTGIRYCNIFFENIDRTYIMDQRDKDLWTAELKALKAQFYFELFRYYGPIILVPENIDANADLSDMQQLRRPVDTVVNAIVELLDEAMKVLPHRKMKDQDRIAYHSLESAATLKALTLLYAASPLFNGNPNYASFVNKKGEQLFPQNYDKEKWKRAADAADAAILICKEGNLKLASGNFSGETDLRNIMIDLENSVLASNFESDEAIFMVKTKESLLKDGWCSYVLPRFESSDRDYFSGVQGGLYPSMKMVEMYYTDNGLPIEQDKTWDYATRYQLSGETNPEYRSVLPLNTNDILALHLRREPRFYANIAADRTYWIRTGFTINDDASIVKMYRGERWGSLFDRINEDDAQSLSGYYLKKNLYSGYNNKEYNTLGAREEPFVIMRLAELYLISAEAWNEYLETPDSRVYDPLDEVRQRAGIPKVRDAWQMYAKDPNKVNNREGMREIIRQEWNIEFAFEGRRFWNLRRWLTAADELNTPLYGWNILGQTAQEFYNNFEGPIPVWTKRKFVAPRDYLFPIRAEEVLIANCEQNPGW